MIYQVLHHPDLLASCDLASPRSRPIGVGPAVEFCRERSEADLIAWVPNISSIYGQAREPHPGMIGAAVAEIAFVHGKAAGEAAMRAVQVGTIHAFSNCFLMTKERFRHYAAWCWAAINGLLELERGGNAHLVPFDLTKPRNLGFLAERLLPIYVLVHELHGTYLFRT